MPRTKKVKKIRGTGKGKSEGEPTKILTLRTQYAVDRFGVYVQRRMRIAQLRALREGLPRLVELRKHLARKQGKESADYALVKETVERYVGLAETIKKSELVNYKGQMPTYDPDLEGKVYG